MLPEAEASEASIASEKFPHHVRARRAEDEGHNKISRWIYPGWGFCQVGSKKVGEGNLGSRKRGAEAMATRLTMREKNEGKKGLGEQEEVRDLGAGGLKRRKREEYGC